jgi:hypothetical protein
MRSLRARLFSFFAACHVRVRDRAVQTTKSHGGMPHRHARRQATAVKHATSTLSQSLWLPLGPTRQPLVVGGYLPMARLRSAQATHTLRTEREEMNQGDST